MATQTIPEMVLRTEQGCLRTSSEWQSAVFFSLWDRMSTDPDANTPNDIWILEAIDNLLLWWKPREIHFLARRLVL